MQRAPELRTRGERRMAALIPFEVPTRSDKTLLVWELSSGPTAEDLQVSRSGVEGGRDGGGRPRPNNWDAGSPASALGRL